MTGLPDHEARRLLQLVSGLDGVGILKELDPGQAISYQQLVKRRLAGEPLQYIEGTVQFGPVTVKVDRRALIPRPETEVLWERAVQALGTADRQTVIVDMCTGSGNLALALRQAFPEARVVATDVDKGAISLAQENLVGQNVPVLAGDLFLALPAELEERIDLLVVNPPYVPASADLPDEIHDYEPHRALYAGPAGDEILARLAPEAPNWVKPGGWLFVEIGEDQAERAVDLFRGFDCEVQSDLTGRPRILAGHRSG